MFILFLTEETIQPSYRKRVAVCTRTLDKPILTNLYALSLPFPHLTGVQDIVIFYSLLKSLSAFSQPKIS